MRYIGNKQSLVEQIKIVMDKHDIKGETFLDIFAGTHSVGKFFKKQGYTVFANDWQTYSYVCGKALIENTTYPTFNYLVEKKWFQTIKKQKPQLNNYQIVLEYLNGIEGIEGFVFLNYCLGGTKEKEHERMYFSDENGKKFDAIRTKIEKWKNEKIINEAEFYILLYGLINDIDSVANTTGVYGSFLKKINSHAKKKLILKPINFTLEKGNHKVHKENALELAKKIKADITYLDPPYNSRQYSPNYHLLETMALYDNPEIKGKTGLRNYDHQKSDFSSKPKVIQAFRELIQTLNTNYIIFSYNNEGILKHQDIMEILSEKGEAFCEEIDYKRYRSDKDSENRNYKANRVKELVYICTVKK